MEFRKGALLGGEYRVEAVLTVKDTEPVLAATGVQTGRVVAIRVLPVGASGPHMVSRFAKAQLIESPHVPRLITMGSLGDGRTYVVMEYVYGANLKRHIQKAPLSIVEACDYIIDACHAVGAAHAANVVHRRLRTSSLVLTRDKEGLPIVKVLDFGLRRVEGASKLIDHPQYLAPEQLVLGASNGNERQTDIWALGVILYELLTGKLPFDAFTRRGLIRKIVTEEPRSPRAVRKDLPWDIDQAILRCLEKHLVSRADHVLELATALAEHASDRGRRTLEQILQLPAPQHAPIAAVAARSESAPPARPRKPSRKQGTLPNVAQITITGDAPHSEGDSAGSWSVGASAAHRREVSQVGFHKMASDGGVENLGAAGMAHLVRAERINQKVDRIAEAIRANPPQPQPDPVELEPEIRSIAQSRPDLAVSTRSMTGWIVALILVIALLIGLLSGLLIRHFQAPPKAAPKPPAIHFVE